jgi:hypothetical protein
LPELDPIPHFHPSLIQSTLAKPTKFVPFLTKFNTIFGDHFHRLHSLFLLEDTQLGLAFWVEWHLARDGLRWIFFQKKKRRKEECGGNNGQEGAKREVEWGQRGK